MELLDCVSEDDIFTIDFNKLNLDERTMLFFFFCVQCEKDTDAIQRLWINGEMVCLCGHGKRQIHTLHLSAGNNVFCFQQHDSIKVIKTTFRIKSLEADLNDDVPLTEGNLCYQKGLIEVSRYNAFNYLDVKFSYYTINGELKETHTEVYLSQPKNY